MRRVPGDVALLAGVHMTERYVMHMMKERSKGVETAKCGVEVKTTKSTPPMTIWWRAVDCPGCLAVMNLQEPPVKPPMVVQSNVPQPGKIDPPSKRTIPRQ
jgi:hypothetical protein